MKNLKKQESEQKIALFINFETARDLPTIEEIITRAKEFGKIISAKIYLEQEEMDNYRDMLTEISKLGIEPIVTVLAKDVRLVIDMLDAAYDPVIDAIVVSHNKESILPALLHAKSLKRLIIIAPGRIPKSFKTVTENVIEL